MSVPTFVDLQGFIVDKTFVVKEFAVLREGHILSHYIFGHPYPWDLLSKSEKSCASWLTAKHHGLRWEDGIIPYYKAKEFITKAVIGTKDNDDDDDDDNNLVYVKGYEKREWLQNLLQDDAREDVYIENIDAHYEDMESLNKLDITHTLRCQKHVTNCALQNVFKLFNWWHQRHQK